MHSLCIASRPPAVTQALPCSGEQSLVLPLFYKQEVLAPSAQASPPAPMTVRASGKVSHLCICPLREAETLQRWPQIKAERLLAVNGECGSGNSLATFSAHNEIYFGAVNWFFCMFLEPYHLPFTQGL